MAPPSRSCVLPSQQLPGTAPIAIDESAHAIAKHALRILIYKDNMPERLEVRFRLELCHVPGAGLLAKGEARIREGLAALLSPERTSSSANLAAQLPSPRGETTFCSLCYTTRFFRCGSGGCAAYAPSSRNQGSRNYVASHVLSPSFKAPVSATRLTFAILARHPSMSAPILLLAERPAIQGAGSAISPKADTAIKLSTIVFVVISGSQFEPATAASYRWRFTGGTRSSHLGMSRSIK